MDLIDNMSCTDQLAGYRDMERDVCYTYVCLKLCCMMIQACTHRGVRQDICATMSDIKRDNRVYLPAL